MFFKSADLYLYQRHISRTQPSVMARLFANMHNKGMMRAAMAESAIDLSDRSIPSQELRIHDMVSSFFDVTTCRFGLQYLNF